MKILIGLGNPGSEYEDNRHNIGFMIMDKIARESEAEFKFDKKINAEIAKGKFGGKPAMLVKPHTFVNKSGEAVKKAKNAYKIKPTDIIVVHDDLDIGFGLFKISFEKNAGGHKGVQNIIDHLKTNKFWRLRIGTANRKLTTARHQRTLKQKKESIGDFVLSEFSPAEKTELKKIIKKALEGLGKMVF
jgi:PTH1 family peptidyl-tRNA hydrolase